MKKFAFIGAGIVNFTRAIIRDLLTYPAFEDAQFYLMDIDREKLDGIRACVDNIVAAFGNKATVVSTMDRREALDGADGVLCTVFNGDIDIWRYDVEIPKQFGVDTNIGDTRSVSGMFRALRNIPLMLDICRDIEELCPHAVFLNYTNPMSMLCKAMQANTKVCVTGLCHSVQGTAAQLAQWIGADESEITYLCAGVNHQAFFLEFKRNGVDAYPQIFEAVKKKEIYESDIVRCEMLKHLDYFPTESSGHNSEYNAWFRKRPDLIEKYCTHGTGWNPGEYAYILGEYRKRESTWKGEMDKWFTEPLELKRGFEYAAYIFNAIFGDNEMFKFNGNVRNFGLIDNLPAGCCVEVPVLASKRGLEPIAVGKMPPQLALLSGTSAQIEEMVVEASLTGDKEMVYQAVCYDPLTAAVCSLREIRDMVNEMFEQNADWLPQFKGGKL